MSELKLSAIQQRVLTILQNEQKAISAYALLEKVKPYGLQSPVQIYRILKKLSGHGLILRLDTLNKYLAYELKNKQNYLFITICTDCHTVQVIDSPKFTQVFEQSLVHQDFSPKHHCLELLGQCALCFSKRNKPFIKISEKANG